VGRVFAALSDPTGVIAHRPGALERVALLLADWRSAGDKLADTEARMVAILDDLQLTALVTSIPGLSAIGAAAILAETGDPNRFTSARALVKHAGLAPREKLSGSFVGRTKLTGAGGPGCASRPGARSGEPTAAIPSTPTGTATSPQETRTSSPPHRRRP
jgi:transposase